MLAVRENLLMTTYDLPGFFLFIQLKTASKHL